jgi:hypothetical protein
MGVLRVQSVVPFMDFVTPAGTTPPYAITLPKVTVEADVPLPPNAIPPAAELKVKVRDAALAGDTHSEASVRAAPMILEMIQNLLGILHHKDERGVAP